MRYSSVCLIAGLHLFCNSASAQVTKKDPTAPGENIYRHYTGMIGGKHVVLDLRYGYQGASNYGGSNLYYPDSDEMMKFIIRQPPTFDHDVEMVGRESPADDNRLSDDFNEGPSPEWRFRILPGRITGKWINPSGSESYDIDLTEDYRESTPMDMYVFRKNWPEKVKRDDPTNISVYINTTVPASPSMVDASFIANAQMRFIDANEPGPMNWKSYSDKYFDRLVREATNSKETGNLEAHMKMTSFMPVYNDNSLLVLEKETYSMEVKQGPVITERYLSLDTRTHRILQADDMLDTRDAKLPAVLETVFREKYSIAADKKLSTVLMRDDVPVTSNVYPCRKGIYFCYDKGVLAQNKAVALYVPYQKLGSIVKDDFKKRMNWK